MRFNKINNLSLAAAGVALILGFASGCGGSEEEPVSSVPATAETQAETPAEDCGSASLEIKAALVVMGAVTGVEVPSCDKAVVTTSLGADEGDQAASICQNAANEASSHGVAAVSVVSADGKELATGTNAEDCKAT